MAITRFSKYLREQNHDSNGGNKKPTSKTIEYSDDGFDIAIYITLSRQEQHSQAIEFLRRVADELSALERATRKRQ
jgi:hypothetical protein